MTYERARSLTVVALSLAVGACNPPDDPASFAPTANAPAPFGPRVASPGPVALGSPTMATTVSITAYVDDCPAGPLPLRTERSLVVDASHAGTLFVGVEGKGLLRSIDGGAHWRRTVKGFRALFARKLNDYCFDRFSSAHMDLRDPSHLCVGVHSRPGDGRNLFTAADGIYCTTDAGEDWQQLNNADMNAAVTAVGIDPSGVLYAGVDGNVGTDGLPLDHSGVLYQSTDGGGQWGEVDFGPGYVPGMNVASLVPTGTVTGGSTRLFAAIPVELVPPGGGNVILQPQYGIVARGLSGATWTLLSNGMGASPDAMRITHLAVSPVQPDHLLAIDAAQHGGGGPFVYYSLDGGQSFHGPSAPSTLALDVTAFDPRDGSGRHALGFAASSTHLFETSDAGDTWTDLGALLPAETAGNPVVLSNLVWSSDGGRIYVTGSHASIYVSTDGGQHFTRLLGQADLSTITD